MDFKKLFAQLSVLYEKLTNQQKLIIAGAIVGIVAFLIFLVVYTAKKDTANSYVSLFESLTPEEASKIVSQLEKDNIPYKLEENNIIKVPRDKVYKQRLNIASLGIPKNSGVGFELFDKQEFGATSFDQKIKHLRALEGELSRTIDALAPVKKSTVSLALPKESLFVSKQAEPTASVMVELVDGRSLNAKQVRGIKNLVSASVSKLKPSNVMIISSDGITLGDDDELAQMSELSIAQQRYKLKEEKKRQEKIIDVIAPFVGGRDKVVAQVSIDFDFSQKSSTSEIYDPENVVRSEQVSEEKREGSSPQDIGGVPGTVSNIGPVQGLKSNKITEKYSKNTGTTNYEVGKTVKTTKAQFARVKRITAGIVVDGKYKPLEDGSGVEYVALQKSDLDALSSLASHSIGIDEKRGDQISVQNLQFERTKTEGLDGINKALSFTQLYLAPFSEIFKYIFVLILLLIIYKKVISPFADKMLEVSKEDEELVAPSLEMDDDEDENLVEKVQEMRKKVEEQLGLSEGFNEEELKHEVLLEKVKTMAEDSPEEVAALLQALLTEEVDLASLGTSKVDKG